MITSMDNPVRPYARYWYRGTKYATILFAWTLVSAYFDSRSAMIRWDFGTIERLCGGETEEDRLLEILWIRDWEYKALKKTEGGQQVWMHWKLTKRHCGNWMLVDQNQRNLIRPLELRFPNGVPPRHGFDCAGNPTYR